MAVTVFALVVSVPLRPLTGDGFFGLLYGAVAASVWFGGPGPGLTSVALGAFGSRLLLLPPLLSPRVDPGEGLARWYVFVPVSLLITVLGRAMWQDRARAERAQAAAERTATRASLLAEVGADLDTARNLQSAAQILADRVVAGLAEVAVVNLTRQGAAPLVAVASAPSIDDSALRPVAAQLPESAPTAAVPPPDEEQLRAAGIHSSYSVPLIARGQPVGGMLLGHGPGRPPVTDDDRLFASELATRAGLALANIRLHEQEHAIAYELQRSLLPRRLPEPAGVVVGACYLPAQAELMVGGDWYDVLELPGRRVGLVVGDVAGHGVEAAASMGQLRSGLAGLALAGDQPAVLLERAQQFSERLAPTLYATLALANLDPGTGSFTYACAGHPPPLVITQAGTAVFLWEGRSTPIGFPSALRRQQARGRLGVGDTLVLYTDGLVETRHEYIGQGFDRLAAHAATLADRPVERLCLELTRLMIGPRLSRDDIAVLAVRLTRPDRDAIIAAAY